MWGGILGFGETTESFQRGRGWFGCLGREKAEREKRQGELGEEKAGGCFFSWQRRVSIVFRRKREDSEGEQRGEDSKEVTARFSRGD